METSDGQETAPVLLATPVSRKNSQVPSATGIRRAAMDWLARREYSRHEIEQKLCRRFPDATAAIGPVLDQLEHEGLLSDARYLETIIHSHVRRGYGPLRIRAALSAKGVAGRDRQGADTESPKPGLPTSEPVNWLLQAREARRRKFGESLPADAGERARQMQFLLRRGFPSAVCRQACLPPRED